MLSHKTIGSPSRRDRGPVPTQPNQMVSLKARWVSFKLRTLGDSFDATYHEARLRLSPEELNAAVDHPLVPIRLGVQEHLVKILDNITDSQQEPLKGSTCKPVVG